ncbi:MAG: PspC protein, partial [Bacteroidetes bacterium]|nr:PspC protein [Bacteroidota bacterium]
RLSVEKSKNDSFYIEVQRSSRGRSIAQARTLAREISYPITQQDSVIYLPAGISIPRNSKFRDQRVRIIVRVPVNKQVEMDSKVRDHYHNWNWDWDNDWDDHHRWDDNDDNDDNNDNGVHVLKMTPDGIDKKDNNRVTDKDSLENNYRYKGKQERNTTPVEDTSKSANATSKGKVAFEGDAISYSLFNLLS